MQHRLPPTPPAIGLTASILGMGNFSVGMGAFLVVGLLVPMAQDMGVSTAQAGALMSVYAGTYAIASPILINCTAPLPRRPVLLAALAIFLCGLLITAFAAQFSTALAGRALSAIGAGIYTPMAANTVYSISPPERRGRMLARLFFGLTVSQAIGMPAGLLMAQHFGWPSALFLTAGICAVSIVALLSLMPLQPRQARIPLRLADLSRNRAGLAAVLLTVLHIGAFSTVYTYIAPLVGAHGHSNPFPLLFAHGIAGALGSLFVGRATDRFGARRVLFAMLLSQVLILPVFSWAAAPPAVLIGAAILWAIFAVSFMVPQQMLLISLVTDHQALILALNATANYVGLAVGAWLGGRVLEGAGLNGLGLAGAAVALLALALFALLARRR